MIELELGRLRDETHPASRVLRLVLYEFASKVKGELTERLAQDVVQKQVGLVSPIELPKKGVDQVFVTVWNMGMGNNGGPGEQLPLSIDITRGLKVGRFGGQSSLYVSNIAYASYNVISGEMSISDSSNWNIGNTWVGLYDRRILKIV